MCARESLDAMSCGSRKQSSVIQRHDRATAAIAVRVESVVVAILLLVLLLLVLRVSSSSSIISKTWKRDYFDCNNAAALRVLLKMPDANALSRREKHEVAMEGEGGCGGRTYLMEQMQKGNVETVQTLIERTRRKDEKRVVTGER